MCPEKKFLIVSKKTLINNKKSENANDVPKSIFYLKQKKILARRLFWIIYNFSKKNRTNYLKQRESGNIRKTIDICFVKKEASNLVQHDEIDG